MLRLHQIVQTLRKIEIVNAVVAHGQLLHPLQRQRLRHTGGNVQNEKLDLQLVTDKSDSHWITSFRLFYTPLL